MQAEAVAAVREREIPRAHDGHRAVHERGGNRTGEHHEDDERARGDCGCTHRDEQRAECGVERHEPPRVAVEVVQREAQRLTGLRHPFTPEETTPEMK